METNNLHFNEKALPIPAFFSISNLGGGGSDKYRETVYGDILQDTPILLNYFYLNQKRLFNLNGFAGPWLKNINEYSTIGDFLNYVRIDMIESSNYISTYHTPKSHDYNSNIILLDSGAANIINNLHKNFNYSTQKNEFINELINIMIDYYDFADRYKFDIVIGFDIGGKYTFKGEELQDSIKELNELISRDSDEINKILLEETIKYIKSKNTYYPKIFATIHGGNPVAYKNYTENVLAMESKYEFKFDGFAGGGIASAKSKELRRSWGISDEVENEVKLLKNVNKNEIFNAILASYACRVIRRTINDTRPIHALGCGGKFNILPLYFAGATSFDSQTPGRRAYDGSATNNKMVRNVSADGSFSKYMVAGITSNGVAITNKEAFEYIKLNKVEDSTLLCDCPACQLTGSLSRLKDVYSNVSMNNKQTEDSYYAKQLINIHGIWQHNYLCKIVQGQDSEVELAEVFETNPMLLASLDYVINKFNYDI